MSVRFMLNGEVREVAARPGETLLDLLRGPCAVTSPKRGCQPQGQCGACVALVDGEARATCTIAAEAAEGRTVVTLEGLPPAARNLFAAAFAATHGLQCGFCTPGIVLRAHTLLEANASPTRAEIAKALDEHLCRCTGYVRILDAIELAARVKRGEAPMPAPVLEGGVGASIEKYRSRELALGERPFVDDLRESGMLFGALTFSPHARARVLKIDTTAARALDGVVAVVTAADVPGERWHGLIYHDWPTFVAEGEEVRCVGDVLAAVAATSEVVARAAAALVEVTYEALPAVLDPEASFAEGAPQVNPKHANLLSRSVIARGDATDALAASAHVVRGTWKTQRIEHLFLEPESTFVVPKADGTLHLYTQGQGIYDDRRQCAALLGIPEEHIFCELVPNGGAFGGKEDMSVQGQTALLAWVTKKPVKLTLSRKESIRLHPKRHPITTELAVGCDAEGRLTAVHARLVGDSGAYASVGMKVLERAAGHMCGPYKVPHVDVEARAAYTNNPPCGAMRGFGVVQSAFALEGALDQLAALCGLDRWEIRWRNAVDIGDVLTTGQPVEKSCGIKESLLAVKDEWQGWMAAGRKAGIACGLKNSGLGNGFVEWGKGRLVVETDGTVSLYNAFTEMGQGLLTILTQVAAEVTGLPSSVFRPKVDATFALGCGQTTGSRATLFAGNAITSAARKLRAALDAGGTLRSLAGQVYAADVVVEDTTPLGAPGKVKTHTSYGYATQMALLDENGRVEKLVAAHDVGRAVNPALCAAQIEGALHMGLGYALTEELPCVDGMPIVTSLYQIGALRAKDMPEVSVKLIEAAEPEGPFGAKGVGELGLVPTAAAVAGALEAYDGVRRYVLPMKDSPAAKAYSVGRIRTKAPKETWR
ncbi:MAG: selenium-dependent xanthine dehydrogenase [Candidatus Eisenbacteria bacterium]|uniref:Selenium-dependent xanthine dehydrogenase n=1 Tax=Eiseniibacteriota bacterium TaxID=2212470 RepID=A0A933S9U2_UNCEI|nr:selenium-dependent xanthine dehydrogenase [Candidatus Eisenbacteria bacterium]